MLKTLKSAILVFGSLTLLTGVIYPLSVTVIAQVCFKHQADGSLIVRDGKPVGSSLIGQQFDDPKYFWGRPSATTPVPCNGSASSGSNLGPSNPELDKAMEQRVSAFQSADPGNTAPVPVDLVTTSASGLDPHISPASAYYQAARVARVRGFPRRTVEAVILRHITKKLWGVLGEPVVNVLEANIELDSITTTEGANGTAQSR
jgi:potassium-transporting ATPase KdpC subunit